MATSDDFFRSVALTDLTLRVRELTTVAAFYRKVLGFLVVTETTERLELSATGAAPALLVLEQAPQAPPRQPGSAGLFHVAFLYPDRAALGRIATRLQNQGVRFATGDHGVSEALYLDDPEGNGVELYADRAVEAWPAAGPDGGVTMYTIAVDLASLIAEGARAAGPVLPVDLRIGHIHLGVSNLAATEQCYARELGFPVRQRNFPGALFLGRDGYHHHLGANTWQSRQPAPSGALGLARFTIRFTPAEEPTKVIARLRQAGREVTERDGGFVAHDPDGIELQIRGA